MKPFNYKNKEIQETLLRKNVEDHGIENTEKPLARFVEEANKESKPSTLNKLLLEKSGKDENAIVEKMLNDGTNTKQVTRSDEGENASLYFKKYEKDLEENSVKEDLDSLEQYKDEDGDYTPEQIKNKKKIVGPNYQSQLFSNYEDREEFRKKTHTIDKKASSSALFDADALLMHIYSSANSDGRELTDKEKNMVSDISNEKIRILSQLYDEEVDTEIHNKEKQEIESVDSLENKEDLGIEEEVEDDLSGLAELEKNCM